MLIVYQSRERVQEDQGEAWWKRAKIWRRKWWGAKGGGRKRVGEGNVGRY